MKMILKVFLVVLFYICFFVFLISVANERVNTAANQLSIYLPLVYLFVFPVIMFWGRRRSK